MGAVATTSLTLADFEKLPDDGLDHEASVGELLTLPVAKSLHTLTALAVQEALLEQLRGKEFKVLAEAGYLLCADPLTIRKTDVSVLSKSRIAATPRDSYFEGAPELAIEVVSPSDLAAEVQTKVHQYLKYGAQQVWVLYPDTKDVHVFHTGSAGRILSDSQTLEGGQLLPGLSVPVSELFPQ